MSKLLLLVGLFISISSMGQTISWTGNGDGLNWDDPLNWDSGNVPISTDDVEISSKDITKDSVICSTHIEIKSLVIGGNNTLRILNNVTFKIDSASGSGCEVNGTIRNRGILTIEDNAEIALHISSIGRYMGFGSSQLIINRSDTTGILNEGQILLDSNTLADLNTCKSFFVYNTGYIESRGEIETSFQLESTAFVNYGDWVNTGSFSHVGSIPAIIVKDTGFVQNLGEITINSGIATSIEVNGSSAEFLNDSTGIINSGQIKVKSHSQFVNKNFMDLTSFNNLLISGPFSSFINEDTLQCTSTTASAVVLELGATLENKGYTFVDNRDLVQSHLVIVDSSLFSNTGYFELDADHKNKAVSIERSGSMVNSDSMFYKNVSTGDFAGIIYKYSFHIVSGSLINEPSGVFQIDSSSSADQYYFVIRNEDSLINRGNMSLKKLGYVISNEGYVENSGLLKFKSLHERAYVDQAGGEFKNLADAEVRYEDSHVAFLHFNDIKAKYSNFGTISFADCSSDSRLFWGHGDFTNDGLFIADSTNSGSISFTDGQFVNDSCGIMSVSVPLFISASTAKNYGKLEYLYSSIGYNHEYPENFGLILNAKGKQIFTLTNHGYITRELSGYFSDGIAEKPIFFQGDSPYPLVSLVFLDETSTSSIGTFTDNALLAEKDTSGNFILYFELAHKPSCPLNKFQVAFEEPDCQTTETNTFIAGSTMSDWFDDDNWSLGYVPDHCSNTFIPAGKKVSIDAPYRAKSNKLEIETSAVFDLESGAVLDVWNGF